LLFFTIFSSLPIYALLINFLILPASLNIVKKTYLPDPTVFTSFFYFFIASFIFELILIINFKGLNSDGLLTLAYFSFMNSFLGVVLFIIYRSIRKYLTGEVIRF
jgi:hypothetical protein